jgi:DNA polymerase-3 subunit gamma/tau
MSTVHLNLARKLRPRTFDQIVGQSLVVRLLKNSLYRQNFFPVYLFSGQRGCGKTTLARIFAAGLNCEKLSDFCKNPRTVNIPCLSCDSCLVMGNGNHPDIVEIDAASHTGVDNVRQIIQAAAFIPLVGRKKVYLIDEAHMLSKAAFNAFLKILEEPPASALFLLATTDPNKILETVRSRCFQLFLEPVPLNLLTDYLTDVCKQEELESDKDGIRLVAQECDGSVRDALNFIERGRLYQGKITRATMLELLGQCDNSFYIRLLQTLDLLPALFDLVEEAAQKHCSWVMMARKLAILIHLGILNKFGLQGDKTWFSSSEVTEAVGRFSVERLIRMLELCYDFEQSITKTQTPRAVFDLLLIKMSKTDNGPSEPDLKEVEVKKKSKSEPQAVFQEQAPNVPQETAYGPWNAFINLLTTVNDPLVLSIFKQATFRKHLPGRVEICFPRTLLFFKDMLEETVKVWKPCIDKSFEQEVECIPFFEDGLPSATIIPQAKEFSAEQPKLTVPRLSKDDKKKQAGAALDLYDKEKWKKVHEVMDIFPGTVREQEGASHG